MKIASTYPTLTFLHFCNGRFEMSGRKLSLGAQSEGSPVAPEMKSVHFSRNIALTRESPAVNADSDREPAATSEGNAAPSPKVRRISDPLELHVACCTNRK